MSVNRDSKFDRVDNFRDFGGFRVRSGGQIRNGLLFRSGRPAEATDADQARLNALNIAVVVDLRRGDERRSHPTRSWRPDLEIITSDLGGEADPWVGFLKAGDLNDRSVRGYLEAFYGNACFEPRHVDRFSRYFTALEAASGPILIHCAAGKDRTGLLAALTLGVLGASDEDIIGDYLGTNRVWTYEEQGAAVARAIAADAGQHMDERTVRTAMKVEAAYLDIAFDAIRRRAGSTEAYAVDVLGVSAARRKAIVARLVDSAAVAAHG